MYAVDNKGITLSSNQIGLKTAKILKLHIVKTAGFRYFTKLTSQQFSCLNCLADFCLVVIGIFIDSKKYTHMELQENAF